MTPETARRDALLRFGNRASTKERVAGIDTALFLQSVSSDISYACRQLIKNPGFALTAIVVLTLGISASVAIFAFVDAMLIKPLPYQDPSRLISLFESTPLGPRFHLSYLDYLDWKRLNHSFASMEAFDPDPLALKTANGVQRVDGAVVGAGFFRMLGVAPTLGRDFRSGEDKVGAPGIVILSYDSWQSRFGKQNDIVGKTVTLDGVARVIVGVLPQEFSFAPAGPAEFWMPIQSNEKPEYRGEHGLLAFARLKNDVSLPTASAEMAAIAQRRAKQYPDADDGRGHRVASHWLWSAACVLRLLLLRRAAAPFHCLRQRSGLLLVRFQSRQWKSRCAARWACLRGSSASSPLKRWCSRQGQFDGHCLRVRDHLFCANSFRQLVAAGCT
jgi:hypothetical protein